MINQESPDRSAGDEFAGDLLGHTNGSIEYSLDKPVFQDKLSVLLERRPRISAFPQPLYNKQPSIEETIDDKTDKSKRSFKLCGWINFMVLALLSGTAIIALLIHLELLSKRHEDLSQTLSEVKLLHGKQMANITNLKRFLNETDQTKTYEMWLNNSIPKQCLTYLDLDDRTRFHEFQSEEPYVCDNGNSKVRNDFRGENWYRITQPAGTKLAGRRAEKTYYHCGTEASGWLESKHPSELWQTLKARVCFNWNDDCGWNTKINVTNCGTYFVYWLPGLPCGKVSRRYCTI